MHRFDHLVTLLTERPASAAPTRTRSPLLAVLGLGTAAVVLVVLKYGIAWHPEWARLHDAAVHWPQIGDSALITAGDRSLLSNISLAYVAGLLRAVTVPAYFAVCSIAILIALALPFAMRWRSALFAQLAFVVVAGGALAPVLLAWNGGYDAAVVIAGVVAGLSRRTWLAGVGWLALGFSHAAVAGVGLLIWLPVMWVSGNASVRARLSRAGVALAGVILGWLAIRTLTDAWGGSTDRLSLFRSISFGDIASSFANALPLVLFGTLGVAWLLLIDPRVRAARSSRAMLVMALVAALAVPLIAVDQTRIVVLVLVAAVMAWLDDLSRHPLLESGIERGTWRAWIAAAAIVPVPVVWMGVVLYPGWGSVTDWFALLGWS